LTAMTFSLRMMVLRRCGPARALTRCVSIGCHRVLYRADSCDVCPHAIHGVIAPIFRPGGHSARVTRAAVMRTASRRCQLHVELLRCPARARAGCRAALASRVFLSSYATVLYARLSDRLSFLLFLRRETTDRERGAGQAARHTGSLTARRR